MGILTTQDSARAFSSYVMAFGLALLIASAVYLSKLDNWAEKSVCVPDDTLVPLSSGSNDIILCSQFNTWRSVAIIGIVIGVIDVFLLPFLCCCTTCAVCGCLALVCVCFSNTSSDSPQNGTTTTRTTTTRTTTTTTRINRGEASEEVIVTETPTDKKDKNNLDDLPPKALTFLNVLGWIFWVFLPFIGTALMTVWLYKSDAVRTDNDEFYPTALALFVIALLNLMVYSQKLINSLCSYGSEKIKPKKSNEENDGEEATRLRRYNEV